MPWKILDRLLLPAVFFLIAFVVALTLWQLLIGHRRAEIQSVTNEQAIFVKTKMESELKARIVPLERLAGRAVEGEGENTSSIEFDAKLVMSAYPAYQALEWVDSTYHVRWVIPPAENEQEVGPDIETDAQTRAVLQAASQSGDTLLTHPVNLRHGGRGFLICVPVAAKAQPPAFLVGVFRYRGSDSLHSAKRGARAIGYRFTTATSKSTVPAPSWHRAMRTGLNSRMSIFSN